MSIVHTKDEQEALDNIRQFVSNQKDLKQLALEGLEMAWNKDPKINWTRSHEIALNLFPLIEAGRNAEDFKPLEWLRLGLLLGLTLGNSHGVTDGSKIAYRYWLRTIQETGKEPTAGQMVSHLKDNGIPYNGSFPQTYSRWKKAWKKAPLSPDEVESKLSRISVDLTLD
ncbi:MAG: hypothetical protein O3C43_07585 [Verrucomicrobia bacterium]|nr:hypothetical protein [Verrucomicrobiota bacterium]